MQGWAWILAASPVAIAVYAYAVYPLLLRLAARAPRSAAAAAELPYVTVVVPAYNEEAQIAGAIEALLAQDYPADRRQILVLSDASTDRTDTIVESYAGRGVELLRMPVRSGKTAAENASCDVIRGEIVVNTDASIRFHPRCVSALVAAMEDPDVGVASGRDVSIAVAESGANATEAGYVGYEMRIRALETAAGGIVGASGSGYAIRAELHKRPVRGDLSRDFSAALTAHTFGFRAVSVSEAICYVPRTASLRSEYRRKVRTIRRGMETLLFRRDLLNPFRHGLFAWKLFSHKVCRWAVPISLMPAGIGLVVLATELVWARVVVGAGLAGVTLGVAGALWPAGRRIPPVVSTLAFGGAANLAVVHALARVLRRDDAAVWEPTRRTAVSRDPTEAR